MKFSALTAAFGISLVFAGQIAAADLPAMMQEAPVPPPQEESGIWAAIAYSSVDAKHGFFWGADKRQEAMDNALEHCENAGGEACTVVTVFRNHRHWDDDDGTGFPYHHCGALAVAEKEVAPVTPWAAKAAPTRREAEEHALQACKASGGECRIREWVCT